MKEEEFMAEQTMDTLTDAEVLLPQGMTAV
jgi:hypothetical protein